MLRQRISFIVPAYNEERLLGATLDALHAAGRAAGEPYELIVVDDASTDRTALIARGHGALLVRVAHRQIAATRNAGARCANGDMDICVDADRCGKQAAVVNCGHILSVKWLWCSGAWRSEDPGPSNSGRAWSSGMRNGARTRGEMLNLSLRGLDGEGP